MKLNDAKYHITNIVEQTLLVHRWINIDQSHQIRTNYQIVYLLSKQIINVWYLFMVLTILVKINETFGCATQEMHTWWQFPPRIDHWNEINIYVFKKVESNAIILQHLGIKYSFHYLMAMKMTLMDKRTCGWLKTISSVIFIEVIPKIELNILTINTSIVFSGEVEINILKVKNKS